MRLSGKETANNGACRKTTDYGANIVIPPITKTVMVMSVMVAWPPMAFATLIATHPAPMPAFILPGIGTSRHRHPGRQDSDRCAAERLHITLPRFRRRNRHFRFHVRGCRRNYG